MTRRTIGIPVLGLRQFTYYLNKDKQQHQGRTQGGKNRRKSKTRAQNRTQYLGPAPRNQWFETLKKAIMIAIRIAAEYR